MRESTVTMTLAKWDKIAAALRRAWGDLCGASVIEYEDGTIWERDPFASEGEHPAARLCCDALEAVLGKDASMLELIESTSTREMTAEESAASDRRSEASPFIAALKANRAAKKQDQPHA